MTDLIRDAAAKALLDAGWNYNPRSLPPTPENLADAVVAAVVPLVREQAIREVQTDRDDLAERLAAVGELVTRASWRVILPGWVRTRDLQEALLHADWRNRMRKVTGTEEAS